MKEVYEKAIKTYGEGIQLLMAIEEMSELTKEITKQWRGNDNIDHIAEEIADVEIMLEQLQLIFKCHDKVAEWKTKKLLRLINRLEMESDE